MLCPDLPQLLTEDESLSVITTPGSSDEDVCGVTAAEAEHNDGDGEDGIKTPTSSEHNIPVLPKRPPPPAPERLEKPTPADSRKRRRLSLSLRLEGNEVIDLPSEDVESLFQLRSLAEKGDKIKKRSRIGGKDRDGSPCS